MDASIGKRVRDRITENARGRTHREIAAAIGMTPDAFSRALNGSRAFTAVELVDLAQMLGTSSHWFVTGESDPFAVRVAGRHTFDHDLMTHQDVDWDEAQRILSDVALAYVQAFGNSPRVRASRAVKPNAAQVRADLILAGGKGFVRTLAETVEKAFGVDVVRLAGVREGFALDVVGYSAIIVGETGNWFYENWSIAHELAHVLFGHLSELGNRACDDPAAERAANAFAADLLLPETEVRRIDWTRITPTDLASFVWTAGVSTDALRRRLASLKISASATTMDLLQLKTQALLRKHWAGNADIDEITVRMQQASARRFPDHLVAAHRIGVSSGLLGSATLAWMLGVDPSDLDSELAPSRESGDIHWLAQELGFSDEPS
jgi:Zn-dependent peptidase ImmA (M78 family)